MLSLTKMPHTLTNSPTNTSPHTTSSIQPEASNSSSTLHRKAVSKSCTNALQIPKKMTAKTTPVEIGTRGTVGSLILREIEFFSQLELGCQDSLHKPCKPTEKPSSSSSNKIKLGSLTTPPKKKKKAGSKFIPSMCNMVEVAESSQPTSKSGFSYRNLKADIKSLQA